VAHFALACWSNAGSASVKMSKLGNESLQIRPTRALIVLAGRGALLFCFHDQAEEPVMLWRVGFLHECGSRSNSAVHGRNLASPRQDLGLTPDSNQSRDRLQNRSPQKKEKGYA
jgi:hypothetical protein